ncbi:MAG: Kinesin motor domain containing [Trebouxia sp. A1-2]|nr:MAG: Kinesin motor domain containing [Trebouxia sp. A1-2]
MSYVEIYNERLHDLLQPFKPNAHLDPQDMRKRKAGLEVKERHGQTCVPGALLVRVDTVQAALALVRKGNLSRAVRHTEMNQHSSRSHTILQVVVEQRLRGSMLRSKLNFVDLAGSERWSERVEMSEVRVNEMTSINQSLSTLITVVASLTEEGRSHIPYRDSKLTHLLQDSLGGNCNTTIIATISPSALAFEETCVGVQRDRPATVSSPVTSPVTTQIADKKVIGSAASHSPSPFANLLPRSSSDRALGGYYMDPSRQGSLLATSASGSGVGQSANPSRQNSDKVASVNRAEVGRLRAELLLAKEDLLAERAARLRLESVVVASQRYFSQRNPQAAVLGSEPEMAGSSSASMSYGADDSASQLPSSSSAAHVGRSSLFPSPSSSSFTSMGRSSLQWLPGAMSRGRSGADEDSAALQQGAHVSLASAGAALQQRYLPSESSLPSFRDGSSTPMTRGQSGSWGRSSINHSPEAPQAVRDADTAFEQQAGASQVTAGRSLLAGEASGASSISSPYAAKFAMSPLSSKPGSPSKRTNAAAGSQHPLRSSGKLLKDIGSLDAGSWIYILGNRSSSLTAKQMAKTTQAAASLA